jgi:hypothetical protein
MGPAYYCVKQNTVYTLAFNMSLSSFDNPKSSVLDPEDKYPDTRSFQVGLPTKLVDLIIK